MQTLTSGCFDMLHTGHVHMLHWASKLGRLTVALNSDQSIKDLKGPLRPIVPEQDRQYMLKQLWFVADVVLFHEDRPLRVIAEVTPAYYVIGHSQPDTGPECDLVRSYGGKVMRAPQYGDVSTTKMIERLVQCLRSSVIT